MCVRGGLTSIGKFTREVARATNLTTGPTTLMAYVQVAADYDWDVNVDEVGYKTICVLDQGGEWEQLTTSQKRTFLS
jgi:hypothetical protein